MEQRSSTATGKLCSLENMACFDGALAFGRPTRVWPFTRSYPKTPQKKNSWEKFWTINKNMVRSTF